MEKMSMDVNHGYETEESNLVDKNDEESAYICKDSGITDMELSRERSKSVADGKDYITNGTMREDDVTERLQQLNSDSDEQNIEENNLSNKENVQEETICKTKKPKVVSSNQSRKKTKKQIKEERLKIRSETNRLMREREITIPYHVPKQRTLREFLARKKNRTNVPLNTPSWKMIEIWKDIEKSTKDAFEFFKSSSESESELDNSQVNSEAGKKSLLEVKNDNDYLGDSQDKNVCDSNSTSVKENLNDINDQLKSKDEETKDAASDKNCNGNEIIPSEDMSNKDPEIALSCVTECNDDVVIPQEKPDDSSLKRTSDWVNSIPNLEKSGRTSSRKEELLRKLNPKLLEITPKLSGNPDSFVDLENFRNKIEPGAEKLMKRFLDHYICRRKMEMMEQEGAETVEIDKNDIEGSKNIKELIQKVPGLFKVRPGSKLQKLREDLKKKMEEKWASEHKSEVVQNKDENENGGLDRDDEDLDKISEFGAEEYEDDVNSISDDESIAEGSNNVKDDGSAAFGGVEEALEDLQEVDDTNDYCDTQSSMIPPYQPGGGLLNGGSELTQNDEDITLPRTMLSPYLGLSRDISQGTASQPVSSSNPEMETSRQSNQSNQKISFIPSFLENEHFDLSDAYDLCSGKFPDFASASKATDWQNDDLNLRSKQSQFSQFSKTNSDTEDTQDTLFKKLKSGIMTEKDHCEDEVSSEEEDLEDITKQSALSDDSDDESEKIVLKRKKKTRKNLKFSDDEDDSASENDEHVENVESSDEEEDDQSEPIQDGEDIREVEYDSEEGEILNPAEFFEKEAELSGEEWSGDEDEKGLDALDFEEGDNDNLDDNQVRSELEKIHMRRVLDDDNREIRFLKEMLFEEGDLYEEGEKREGNYRWKDLGTGFLDDKVNNVKSAGEEKTEEEIEEEQAAKLRREKELFFMKQKDNEKEEDNDEDGEINTTVSKLGRVILKKPNELSSSAKSGLARHGMNGLDEISAKKPFGIINQRGSFLSRNEEFLAQLAKYTANASDNVSGPQHSKNFVFASKSPEKEIPPAEEVPPEKRKQTSPKDNLQPRKKTKLGISTSSHGLHSVLDRLT